MRPRQVHVAVAIGEQRVVRARHVRVVSGAHVVANLVDEREIGGRAEAFDHAVSEGGEARRVRGHHVGDAARGRVGAIAREERDEVRSPHSSQRGHRAIGPERAQVREQVPALGDRDLAGENEAHALDEPVVHVRLVRRRDGDVHLGFDRAGSSGGDPRGRRVHDHHVDPRLGVRGGIRDAGRAGTSRRRDDRRGLGRKTRWVDLLDHLPTVLRVADPVDGSRHQDVTGEDGTAEGEDDIPVLDAVDHAAPRVADGGLLGDVGDGGREARVVEQVQADPLPGADPRQPVGAHQHVDPPRDVPPTDEGVRGV